MLKGKYKKDADSIAWLVNYVSVIENSETDLKVADEQINELKAACDELAAKLSEKVALCVTRCGRRRAIFAI